MNQRGSIMVTSLVVVVLITIGGLIAMNALSKKADQKNAYSLHSGGRAKILSNIKLIPQFYDDFLTNNRKISAASLLSLKVLGKIFLDVPLIRK